MTTAFDTQTTARRQRRGFGRDVWTWVSLGMLALFTLFLVYPLWGVLKESVEDGSGGFTLAYFAEFFSRNYYVGTIRNSFLVSFAVTFISLLIGVPFSYFYTYYRLRGSRLLFVGAVL